MFYLIIGIFRVFRQYVHGYNGTCSQISEYLHLGRHVDEVYETLSSKLANNANVAAFIDHIKTSNQQNNKIQEQICVKDITNQQIREFLTERQDQNDIVTFFRTFYIEKKGNLTFLSTRNGIKTLK